MVAPLCLLAAGRERAWRFTSSKSDLEKSEHGA
jgi:hypothetical protein